MSDEEVDFPAISESLTQKELSGFSRL